MEILLSPAAWLSAALIFSLRVTDMTLDTLRVLFVMRGRKLIAWTLSFFAAGVFVLAIGTALSDLSNPLNIVGYAAGFATGNVVGMLIEERLAIGHMLLTIVSPQHGEAVAECLRKSGFAVTEIPALGKDGSVTMLNSSVLRKNVDRVRKVVDEVDPEAFITASDIRPVRRGFWGV